MKQTMEYEISSEVQENIISMAVNDGVDVRQVAGGLQDNVMFENETGIRIGNRMKARKYIIMVEEYVNEWSSAINLIMTDSIQLYQQYQEEFDAMDQDAEDAMLDEKEFLQVEF